MVSKIKSSVISLTLLLGTLFWILDGALDFFFFYRGSFLDITFTNIPPHELYIRSFWFTGLLIVGVLSSRIIKSRDLALKDKQELEELLRSVRNVNQLLVKENDKTTLLQGACDDLYETRGFHHVWIALLDEDGKLISGSEAGLGEKFEPMLKLLETGTLPKKVKQVLEKPEVVTTGKTPESCGDCPLAKECKQGTTITRRLEYDNHIYGLISACVPEHFVKGEELSLFEEVAGDIAFGLHDIEIEEKRKKTRTELQSSKKKLQEIFNNANDAIYLHELNADGSSGQFLEVNDVATEMLGYSRNEFLSMSPQDIDGGRLAEDVPDIMEELISEGQKTFEMYHERKDGSLVPVEISSHVFELDSAERVLSIARDITERRERLAELERSRKRYKAIFENTGTAMSIIEGDTTIAMANDEFASLTGHSLAEIEGKMSWKKIVADKDLDRLKNYHENRRQEDGSVPSSYQYTLVDKSGNEHIVQDTVGMIPETDRNVSSIVEITDLVETEERIRQSFVELAETTSRVLGVRDPYTQKHEQRVAELAREVGRRMGLAEDKLLGLYLGGILHDIGKIAIPETILTKPGELKDVEWQMIQSHPEVGYDQILSDTDFPWPVAEMTLHHHERLDGSGYPDGLEGDELTTEVRILGAVDVVEAMSTRRPYRSARSKEETAEEIKSGKGTKYDPEVVEVLVDMIGESEIKFGGK